MLTGGWINLREPFTYILAINIVSQISLKLILMFNFIISFSSVQTIIELINEYILFIYNLVILSPVVKLKYKQPIKFKLITIFYFYSDDRCLAFAVWILN